MEPMKSKKEWFMMNSLKCKQMRINKLYTILAVTIIGMVVLSGCSRDPESTHYEYAPQMYHSIPIEPFTQSGYHDNFSFYAKFKDSVNAQIPPEGTIAVDGWGEFPYENTEEDRIRAGAELTNPYATMGTERALTDGKVLFERFCAACHGKKGKGNGPVVEKGGFPPPTSYDKKTSAELPQGSIYHIITYGQNTMGSYASQLTHDDRLKVAYYVSTMQKQAAAAPAPAEGEETADAGDTGEETEEAATE